MPFPLKLVGFERYMWADDQPRYPMSYTIRLSCSGRVEPAALVAAVDAAIAQHPMLRARIAGTWHNDLRWIPSPEARPYLNFAPHGEPLRCPWGVRINLREENGLRIWVRSGPHCTAITFQFHHSSSDGVGAYRFIEDVFCAYDQLLRGQRVPSLRPLRPERLRQRARFGLGRRRWLLRIPWECCAIVLGFAGFVMRRTAKLARTDKPPADQIPEDTLPDPLSHTFGGDQLRLLKDAARQSGATLNDLICRELFLGMFAWNSRYNHKMARRNMRLMVPFNLRDPGDEVMPAANVVGMGFLDRRLSNVRRRDPQRLLASIHRSLRAFKRLRVGVTCARACAVLTRVPRPDRILGRSKRCLATAALSNMGTLFGDPALPTRDGKLSAGDLCVQKVESAPPIRRASYASFGIHSYDGQMTLTMNYDRRYFTRTAAEDLLSLIVRQFDETAAEQAAAERPARGDPIHRAESAQDRLQRMGAGVAQAPPHSLALQGPGPTQEKAGTTTAGRVDPPTGAKQPSHRRAPHSRAA